MAKVWFVRRRGGEWIVPGGAPAYEQPLAGLIFPLDLGTHRRIEEAAIPDPSLPREDPSALQRVFVEITSDDLKRHEFSGYEEGFYDSPFSPCTVTRRLQ